MEIVEITKTEFLNENCKPLLKPKSKFVHFSPSILFLIFNYYYTSQLVVYIKEYENDLNCVYILL